MMSINIHVVNLDYYEIIVRMVVTNDVNNLFINISKNIIFKNVISFYALSLYFYLYYACYFIFYYNYIVFDFYLLIIISDYFYLFINYFIMYFRIFETLKNFNTNLLSYSLLMKKNFTYHHDFNYFLKYYHFFKYFYYHLKFFHFIEFFYFTIRHYLILTQSLYLIQYCSLFIVKLNYFFLKMKGFRLLLKFFNF